MTARTFTRDVVRALARDERPAAETPAPASDVVMRFLTLGGATVQVTREMKPTHTESIYPVRCLGCDWDGPEFTSVRYARDKANGHADACRSMPMPTST